MKEIIYTAIFIGLAILLVGLFLIMFRPKKEAPSASQTAASAYIPGVYTASLTVGSQNINVEVAVDADKINSVSFVSLDEAVTTMYPLMQPVLQDLESQIVNSQSLENLSYSMETRYTSQALINAIETALNKAKSK
jgi:uncharacterized protein with FMN-binding domain